MTIEYDDCLKKGRIKSFSQGKELAAKELQSAKEDFDTAKESFKNEKYKWATIQLYYCMFHSARALLYVKNLRERSHLLFNRGGQDIVCGVKKNFYSHLRGLEKSQNVKRRG